MVLYLSSLSACSQQWLYHCDLVIMSDSILREVCRWSVIGILSDLIDQLAAGLGGKKFSLVTRCLAVFKYLLI